MLLCAFVGSAWAQTVITDVAQLSNEKVYTIVPKEVARGAMYATATSTHLDACGGTLNRANNPGIAINAESADQQFALYTHEGSTYLYSIGAGKYVSDVSNTYFPLVAKPGYPVAVVKSDTEGYFTIKVKGSEFVNVSTGWSYGCVGGWNSTDNGNRLLITEVADIPADVFAKLTDDFNQQVTFNYYEGESLITTKTVNIDNGTSIELSMAPAIDYFVNSSFKTPGEYIAGDVKSVDIACESSFPFTAMTITDGQFTSDKFYTLTINNQGTRPVVYKNEGNSPVHTKVGTQALAKENLWAFERVAGKPYVVRLYNMAAGATSSLKAKSQNKIAVTFAATDGYTDEFIVRKNGNNFVLICNVDGGRDLNACINVDAANNGLGVWGDQHNDPGSTFIIAPASDLVDDYTYDAPTGIDENYASEEYVKFVDPRSPELVAKLAAYNENQNYATFVEVLDNLPETALTSTNTISADKFYQLISYNDANCKGKAVYSISGCDKNGGNTVYFDREILIETKVGERPVAETAFQFITVDGGYKIAHANSNYYFAFMSAFNDMSNPDLPISNYGTMVIEPQRDLVNVWSIRGNNNTEKYFHCGTGNDRTIVRQMSPATNDGNLWLIKEITEIPVKVGAAKWSTLCLPMAVVVPEDATLKVFYATGVDTDGNLELEEVEAGTVVAKKQAMLIYSTSENESDTYNFAVSTEAGTTFDGSILSGSTARRGNFNATESEYYALANHEGVVGFYPSVSAKIAANKAYILNSALAEPTNALRLSFGSTTGIDAVEGNVNTTKTIYYDLNGRVVLYPTNGVYVTNTGKKVFIK